MLKFPALLLIWVSIFWIHGADLNSHIWIMWKGVWQIRVLFISSQSITVEIVPQNSPNMVATFVYASCLKRIRKDLWDHLEQISGLVQQQQSPWIVTGDFNVIVDISEKRGGGQIDMGALHDFQDSIMRNELIDAGSADGPGRRSAVSPCQRSVGNGRPTAVSHRARSAVSPGRRSAPVCHWPRSAVGRWQRPSVAHQLIF